MGLKAKHIGELNSLTAKPRRIAKRRFAELRREYANDTAALRGIDIYPQIH
jgi:hypothetical protein